MVIGSDIAGLVINHAAAGALVGKINTIKKVAHITLIGNTHYSGAHLFGGSYNRGIASRAQLLLLLCSGLFSHSRRGFAIATASDQHSCAH